MSSLLRIFWWKVHCYSYVCFYILCVTHLLFFPLPTLLRLLSLLFSCWFMSNSFAPPRTVALQAPLSMGFSRQEYWGGVAISSSRRSLWLRDQTGIFCVSYTGRQIFFIIEPPGKPLLRYNCQIKITYTIHTKNCNYVAWWKC